MVVKIKIKKLKNVIVANVIKKNKKKTNVVVKIKIKK